VTTIKIETPGGPIDTLRCGARCDRLPPRQWVKVGADHRGRIRRHHAEPIRAVAGRVASPGSFASCWPSAAAPSKTSSPPAIMCSRCRSAPGLSVWSGSAWGV